MSLTFKPKSYLRPDTEDELSSLLKKFGEKARIIAGGTGIYEVANRGLFSEVETLLDISALGLSGVSLSNDCLKIGSCTTMTALRASSQINSQVELSGIVDALSAIEPLQVKNVATIGGAICTSLPFFDLPVALLSLNARVVLGPAARKLALSDFIQGYFSVALEPGEFVKEIEVPLVLSSVEGMASAFQKFALTHDDWALINCGVSLHVDLTGRISKPRIIFGGGVGEKPVRARGLEKELEGSNSGDRENIKRIFAGYFSGKDSEVQCTNDIRATSKYRTRLCRIIGARTTLQAIARAVEKDKGAS